MLILWILQVITGFPPAREGAGVERDTELRTHPFQRIDIPVAHCHHNTLAFL